MSMEMVAQSHLPCLNNVLLHLLMDCSKDTMPRFLRMVQTGSGKTYTMGTGFKDGCQTELIPQVMGALFNKIETLKHQTEFQLHVSFIEILREEVRDLLDSASESKSVDANGHAGKVGVPGKSPIQIREAFEWSYNSSRIN
ncbi:hypothetical protein NC651_017539 [Populus alba x Populus x berolinensis]|nr:hypothetical protein NC651_017539 [Populus alba x Populus x berolinensis]